MTEPAPRAIVGAGASAGGVRAFGALVESIPPATGLAYVLIPHLDATRRSHLAAVLAQRAKVPVVELTADARPRPDQIHVLTPGNHVELMDGALLLRPRPPGRAGTYPIDRFFHSLAWELGGAAVGVVLSGAGCDGTVGLAEIRAAGGLTLVQDFAEATFDGMPRSAWRQSGYPDALPAAAIPGRILAHLDDAAVERPGP